MTDIDATRVVIAAILAETEGVRAVRHAMPAVFPWTRHLSEDETREFLQDLADATRDGAGPAAHGRLHRVIVEWRATAVLADPDLTTDPVDPHRRSVRESEPPAS